MIDYQKLADSLSFYEQKGYKRIEAPWWVPSSIVDITRPKDEKEGYFLQKNQKELVASGEQSFLYLANQGLLPEGKYQTITPCFREEVQGPMRRKFFMKNELIIAGSQDTDKLNELIEDCYNFFKKYIENSNKLEIIQTDLGYDINYNNIELGSYGVRETSFLKWIYGTGIAEPRFSRALRVVLNEYK